METIEKASKDKAKLTRKVITNKLGHKQTVWVNKDGDKVSSHALGNFPKTSIAIAQAKKQYLKNEDENNHTGNYLLLAKMYGTKDEIKTIQGIKDRAELRGDGYGMDESNKMHKITNEYYHKLFNKPWKGNPSNQIKGALNFISDTNIKEVVDKLKKETAMTKDTFMLPYQKKEVKLSPHALLSLFINEKGKVAMRLKRKADDVKEIKGWGKGRDWNIDDMGNVQYRMFIYGDSPKRTQHHTTPDRAKNAIKNLPL